MELRPVSPQITAQPAAPTAAAATVAAEERLTTRPVEPASGAEQARQRAAHDQDKVEIRMSRTELHIDRQTHQVFARVRDRDTGEVIRQIPTEESLAHQAKMKEVLGDLIDELA